MYGAVRRLVSCHCTYVLRTYVRNVAWKCWQLRTVFSSLPPPATGTGWRLEAGDPAPVQESCKTGLSWTLLCAFGRPGRSRTAATLYGILSAPLFSQLVGLPKWLWGRATVILGGGGGGGGLSDQGGQPGDVLHLALLPPNNIIGLFMPCSARGAAGGPARSTLRGQLAAYAATWAWSWRRAMWARSEGHKT